MPEKFDLVDKSGWGEGPWQTEPDEVTWSFGDVACRIVRHPRHGQLNGYVGLPPAHPWSRQEVGEIDANVDVHGGITFAGEFGIHLEADEVADEDVFDVVENLSASTYVGLGKTFATRTDNLWWIGFDTHHAWDLAPGFLALERELGLLDRYPSVENLGYKDLEYVRNETNELARQAIDAMLGRELRPIEPARRPNP